MDLSTHFPFLLENYPEDTKRAWEDAKMNFQKSDSREAKRCEAISHDRASDDYCFNRNRKFLGLVTAYHKSKTGREICPLAEILRNNNRKERFYYLHKYAR